MQASLSHSIIPYREPLQSVGNTVVVSGTVESLEGLYRWALQIGWSLFRGSMSTLISGKIKLPDIKDCVKVKLKCIQWGLVLCSPVCVRNAVCVYHQFHHSPFSSCIFIYRAFTCTAQFNSNSLKTGTGFCMTLFPFS